jgi:hypothetical protein
MLWSFMAMGIDRGILTLKDDIYVTPKGGMHFPEGVKGKESDMSKSTGV